MSGAGMTQGYPLAAGPWAWEMWGDEYVLVGGPLRLKIMGCREESRRDWPNDTNARAIAALPECLAALECALANCATILRTNGYHEDPEAVEWCGVSLDRIQRAARAALAKARGEDAEGGDGAR